MATSGIRLGIGTFSDGGRVFAGLLRGDEVVDLTAYGIGSVEAMFASWDATIDWLEGIASKGAATIPLADLRAEPPVRPGQIIQSGANYRRHVIDLILAEERERGNISAEEALVMGERIMDERRDSGEPYLFLGAHSALCGADDDIVLPAHSSKPDWEVELAVVIGRHAFDLAPEDAMQAVAGYTVANDLTSRDLVYRPDLEAIGTDWLRAKNSPTFLPVGPAIIPARFVADPMDLKVRMRLNGEVMQNESTADMIFDIARLVSYASCTLTLSPGDLILTGSPAGNGMHYGRFLQEGDRIEAEVEGLGLQVNRCVSASLSARGVA